MQIPLYGNNSEHLPHLKLSDPIPNTIYISAGHLHKIVQGSLVKRGPKQLAHDSFFILKK